MGDQDDAMRGLVAEGITVAKRELSQGVDTLLEEHSLQSQRWMQQMVNTLQGSIEAVESRLDSQASSEQVPDDLNAKCQELVKEACQKQTQDLTSVIAEMGERINSVTASNRLDGCSKDDLEAMVEQKIEEKRATISTDLRELGELVLGEIAEVRAQTEEKFEMLQKDLQDVLSVHA